MTQQHRSNSREFKVEAVKMITDGGHSTTQVARDLGIGANLLRRWKKQLTEDQRYFFPGKGYLKEPDKELRRLQRENQRLKMEREF